MKTVYGACLRYLTYIPLDTARHWGKGFHISWLPRERSTHIMFSWDYYLDDLCSVITLHVTVQRCSPNINIVLCSHHTVAKEPWNIIEFLGHRISCSQSVFWRSFAMKGREKRLPRHTGYFLVNSRLIEFCSWFYCFQTGWIGFYKYMNIKSEKAEILFTNRPLDESISWLPYPKTKITLFVCRFFNHFY